MVGCWYLSEGPILSGWRRAGSRMSWIRGGFVVRELQQPWLTCRLLFSTSSLPQSKAKHVKLCFHQWEEYLKAARLCLRKVLQGTLFKALCRFSLEMTALWSWGLQVVKIVWLCGGWGVTAQRVVECVSRSPETLAQCSGQGQPQRSAAIKTVAQGLLWQSGS